MASTIVVPVAQPKPARVRAANALPKDLKAPVVAAFEVSGHGLGLRRAMLAELAGDVAEAVDFWEIAPENWLDVGGAHGRRLRAFTERHAVICHGLSLNLGGPDPLDEVFIRRLRQFFDEHGVRGYSEHLSYCADDGQLYDLLPIPFTSEAVEYVAARIARVQDILEQRIAIENVSYYCAPGAEMTELAFITGVLARADCLLLLDVNNIYVNSVNHDYDAADFVRGLAGERIAYAHIAGHARRASDLLVDTHGAAVDELVWQLLDRAYGHFGVVPTVLERDFNLPPMAELLAEAQHIQVMQQAHVVAGGQTVCDE